jgi:hypothetical protein
MEYRYRHLADNEIEPRLETLGLLARDVSDLMLGSKPPLTWITESASGFITWPHPIAGYTSTRGDIFVCADLSPHEIADTIAHECRHSWQKKQPKRLSPGARERDARIFALEFWNGRERTAGDFLEVAYALLDREVELHKAKAAAQTKPSGAAQSDDLRRRFAPVIKARSLAVQRLIDPSGRRLYPDNVEFGSPCATLKLSYEK